MQSGTYEFNNTEFKITGLGKEEIDVYVKLLSIIIKPTLIITDTSLEYKKIGNDNKLTIDHILSKITAKKIL